MTKKCLYCKKYYTRDSNLLTFHRFPSNESLRREWFQAIGRDYVKSKYIYLCSMHFPSEDFIVKFCGNRYLKKNAVPVVASGTNEQKTFRRFPTNENRRKEWLNALNIESVSRSARVCSKHFQESDYSADTIYGKARLKTTAVPCINLTKDSQVTDYPLVNVNKSISDGENENAKEDPNFIGHRVKNGHEDEKIKVDGRRTEHNFRSNIEENVQKRTHEILHNDSENVPLKNIRRFDQINIEEVSKSPEESKMCLEIAKEIMQDQAKKIKILQTSSGRLKNKIRDLKYLIGNLTGQSLSLQYADTCVMAQQESIQNTTDKIERNIYEVSHPTDFLNKLAEKKNSKICVSEEEDTALYNCITEIFGNSSTDGNDNNDSSPILDNFEIITENNNDAITKNEVEEDSERFNIIEAGSLHLYANKNYDRVVSVPVTDEILAEAKKSKVVVYQYGPKKKEIANKRILFLGSVIVQCPECKITLKNGENLKDHIGTMHCGMKIREKKNKLNVTEMKNEKPSKVWSCPICKSNVHTASLLTWHLRTFHKDYKPHLCEKCGRSFKSKFGLAQHVKKYQKFESCDVRKCYFCSEMVSSKDYPNHKNTHEKSFVCGECGIAFMTLHHLQAHSVKHETKEKDLQLCPICGKMAKTLVAHLQTHETGAKKYMCDKCPKLFMTQHHLTGHIRRVHLEYKVVQCTECPKKFSTPSYLKDHYKLKHSNNYRLTCTLCGQGFSRIDYLKRHVNSHSSIGKGIRRRYRYKLPGPATCKYCNKQFKTVHSLRNHILKAHLKILRYKCKFCSLSFSDYSNKYRHERRHKRPGFELSCEICWKRLKTKEELDNHMLSHKGSKKYKCEYCGALYSRQYLLRHHISESHITVEDLENEKEALLADALEEFSV